MGQRVILSERSGVAAGQRTGMVAFRILFNKKCIKCSFQDLNNITKVQMRASVRCHNARSAFHERKESRMIFHHAYVSPTGASRPSSAFSDSRRSIYFLGSTHSSRGIAQVDDSTPFCGVYSPALSTPPPRREREGEIGHRGGDESEQN